MTLQGPCDACSLIDGDTSVKTITKCRACEANLCGRCKTDWGRRAKAASIRAGKALKKAVTKHTHKVTVIRTDTQRRARWVFQQRTPDQGGSS